VAKNRIVDKPPCITDTISGFDPHTKATHPVRHKAINILLKTDTIYFLRPPSIRIGPDVKLIIPPNDYTAHGVL
jgi:hypothetical protein